jgi:predicted DNA-binding protein
MRQPTYKVLSFRLEEDTYERLRALAEHDHRSMGFIVRSAIDSWLAERGRTTVS